MKGSFKKRAARDFDSSDPHDEANCRPFLKWVGGKTQLLSKLKKRLPVDIDRYFEPFLGGGALLFATKPKRAFVSDINHELINTYNVVRNQVEPLIVSLMHHVYEKDYYYKIRGLDRLPSYNKLTDVERASRFIFLNKTCFNGLHRVNSKGQFNTPFGKYVNPKIVDADNLRACSRFLKKVAVRKAGFEEIESLVTKKDFVYFDPPYVPLSTTSDFTAYAKDSFGTECQERLHRLCVKFNSKGTRFMLSNSSTPMVHALYKKFKIEVVPALRAVNSKGSGRGAVEEVIITNF